MHLVQYARNLEILYETPLDIPVHFDLDRRRIKEVFGAVLLGERDILSETASKALLEAYEIPVSKTAIARSADEAVGHARRIGYPVVLKVLSPQITHKTDVGGVRLNLKNDPELLDAYLQMMSAVGERAPEAHVEGVTVQSMVPVQEGIELLLGAKKDATFGTVILVGMGGIAAEISDDRQMGLPPLNERLARRMLSSLRSWPLLQGYRGRPGVNLDHLIEILIRFSYLVADYPEIKEFDINPLWVTPEKIVALDSRAVIDRQAVGMAARPFAHLAIRPYPEQYVKKDLLKDGTPILLRPIRPEDEPLWHALLAACSPDSIRSRFRYLFKASTHAMATRYCFIDYDREMAIVAEIEDKEGRKLIGVGRLVADPDHSIAEYAVLVADPWQGVGLGMMLTQYCLEIAESWGIKRITAETALENNRMIATFRSLGFNFQNDQTGDVVSVSKSLG
jgi:acetyltransferase